MAKRASKKTKTTVRAEVEQSPDPTAPTSEAKPAFTPTSTTLSAPTAGAGSAGAGGLSARIQAHHNQSQATAPHLIVEARAGTGKCLGKGTPVLLYDGRVIPVEEITQGDLLMGPDSMPREVLAVNQGRGALYCVTPTKGDSWICNDEHILTLTGTNRFMGQIRDISVLDYLKEESEQPAYARNWRLWRTGVHFDTTRSQLPVPPYLVGVWMGDGARGGCTIHNSKPAIHAYCRELAQDLGLNCDITEVEQPRGNSYRIHFSSRRRAEPGRKPQKGDNPLYTFFREECAYGETKMIPHAYLTAPQLAREELLAGIIDTDGEEYAYGGSTPVTVTGEAYRDGLLFLARSLGFAAYCGEAKVHVCANERISMYYRISISGDLERLPTLVRKFPARQQVKRVTVTGFNLKPIGDGDYYGFTLDGDGRFLLGDFTVTHNTTTLIEGLKRVKGLPVSIVPSSQQAKVWEMMELSRGVSFIGMVAFNKGIATELQSKVPPGVDAMTMHSMGFKAVNKAFQRLRVNQYRVDNLISSVMGMDVREIRRTKPDLIRVVKDLVGLSKMNLTVVTSKSLEQLTSYYAIEVECSWREVCDLVPAVLDRCKDPLRDGCIDFDDMVWLPVALNLPVFRYDLLLIDERQDLNKCQMQLALKAGCRIVAVGDEKQSIFGFAGADPQACNNFKKLLESTGNGVQYAPLTVTRRCGKVIVKEANKIVPDFEAFESNPEGRITEDLYTHDAENRERPVEKTYVPLVEEGDMILCRVNAPLVSQCFRFLKAGRKANILGRDVGQGLVSTVKKLTKDESDLPVPELIRRLDDWYHQEVEKENAKRNPSEPKLIALQDRLECLHAFCDGATSVISVIARIESVFTDDRKSPGIRLSSIHKAKGLEARRVFFLMPKGGECPHQMAKASWQQEQEMNLKYVAITRAIEELVYVRS